MSERDKGGVEQPCPRCGVLGCWYHCFTQPAPAAAVPEAQDGRGEDVTNDPAAGSSLHEHTEASGQPASQRQHGQGAKDGGRAEPLPEVRPGSGAAVLPGRPDVRDGVPVGGLPLRADDAARVDPSAAVREGERERLAAMKINDRHALEDLLLDANYEHGETPELAGYDKVGRPVFAWLFDGGDDAPMRATLLGGEDAGRPELVDTDPDALLYPVTVLLPESWTWLAAPSLAAPEGTEQ